MDLTIMACRFKRLKTSAWEKGIIINEGEGPLIDEQGKLVDDPVWTFNTLPYSLCVHAFFDKW